MCIRDRNNRTEEYGVEISTESQNYMEPDVTTSNLPRVSKTLETVSVNHSWNSNNTNHIERKFNDYANRSSAKYSYIKNETNRLPFSGFRNTENGNYSLNETLTIKNMSNKNMIVTRSMLSHPSLQKWKIFLLKLAKRNYTSGTYLSLIHISRFQAVRVWSFVVVLAKRFGGLSYSCLLEGHKASCRLIYGCENYFNFYNNAFYRERFAG